MHNFQWDLIMLKFSPRRVLKLSRWRPEDRRIFSLKTRVRKIQHHLNSRIFRCTMATTRTTKIPSQMQTGKSEILFGKTSSRMIHRAGSPLNANINTIIYACALFYCNKILMNLLVLEKFDRKYNGNQLYNDIVSTEWPVAIFCLLKFTQRSRQIHLHVNLHFNITVLTWKKHPEKFGLKI